MKHRFNKDAPLIPVERPIIGEKYHVNWAYSHGVVGICVKVNEENKTVILKTPKTKKEFANPVKWSDLRHIRKNQVENKH